MNAIHIAQFLGKRIAVRSLTEPAAYELYKLCSIHCNHMVIVADQSGKLYRYKWERLANPYVVLEDNEVSIK